MFFCFFFPTSCMWLKKIIIRILNFHAVNLFCRKVNNFQIIFACLLYYLFIIFFFLLTCSYLFQCKQTSRVSSRKPFLNDLPFVEWTVHSFIHPSMHVRSYASIQTTHAYILWKRTWDRGGGGKKVVSMATCFSERDLLSIYCGSVFFL